MDLVPYLFFDFSEHSFCKPNPCSHHATCVETLNGFKCICEEGYKGVQCKGKIARGISTAEKDMSHSDNPLITLMSLKWYYSVKNPTSLEAKQTNEQTNRSLMIPSNVQQLQDCF